MNMLAKEPFVSVGIVSAREVNFSFNGSYKNGQTLSEGNYRATLRGGNILFEGKEYDKLVFQPQAEGATFTLKDVTIGVDFHWERQEMQTFEGSLRLIVADGKICAVNDIKVEDYLRSVISSEMSSTSSLELLKAHAVISRSWLLAQIRNQRVSVGEKSDSRHFIETQDKIVRWSDREDHIHFDVCADDHCQRYQGVGRIHNEFVNKAILATRGQVLTSEGLLCDARFSKCCGGITEEFQYCWDNIKYPYLKAVADVKPVDELNYPDLTKEENAKAWILSDKEAFCNTNDKKVLRQVLNDYDQETADFYRWNVEYSQEDLSSLVQKKTGIDFGEIIDLIPLKRGKSGRIYELKIIGTKYTLTLGKELEIRRALSESHLYSSAFIVNKKFGSNNIPKSFELIGAGWGHGVGLCQIGAAVMGAKGFDYLSILKHYYQGATIEQLY